MKQAGIIVAILCVFACGGGGQQSALPAHDTITVTPELVEIEHLAAVQFTATASDPNEPITWRADSGGVTISGEFTAPVELGRVNVTASYASDPSIKDVGVAAVVFTKDVPVLLKNESATAVTMGSGSQSQVVGAGQTATVTLVNTIWRAESHLIEFQVFADRASGRLTASKNVKGTDGRNNGFHGLIATFGPGDSDLRVDIQWVPVK